MDRQDAVRRKVWDSGVSDQSDGGSSMSKVHVVHATEVLLQAFGVVTASVRLAAVTRDACVSVFHVVDAQGGRWRLDVSRKAQRSLPLDAGLPAESRRIVQRWGRYWMLVAVHAEPLDDPAANDGQADPEPRRCIDGRALECVGSWLAQPAGLPLPNDILGQCFADLWHLHHPLMARFHARAEQLHDALGPHGQGVSVADDAATDGIWSAWLRHRSILRQLVEAQKMLIGPTAVCHPHATRRAALRRLSRLLDAEKARWPADDAYSQAG